MVCKRQHTTPRKRRKTKEWDGRRKVCRSELCVRLKCHPVGLLPLGLRGEDRAPQVLYRWPGWGLVHGGKPVPGSTSSLWGSDVSADGSCVGVKVRRTALAQHGTVHGGQAEGGGAVILVMSGHVGQAFAAVTRLIHATEVVGRTGGAVVVRRSGVVGQGKRGDGHPIHSWCAACVAGKLRLRISDWTRLPFRIIPLTAIILTWRKD